MNSTFLKYIYFLVLTIFILGCQTNYKEPRPSLNTYQIEKGFDLSIVAAEPFIEAPVTIDFDNKGRMWVIEMKGYMRNLEGTGEHDPNGRITILEDLDNDGLIDHTKVFIDSLILPRALAHVYGGLLYAEPPNLWFVEIENDLPKNRVLVDDKYAQGGNVEHQPNGLMMNIDNWIYNAKSYNRYQLKSGNWIKEPTFFRGQWGISKDNFGRLYHNNNSTILKGDIVLPNTFANNKFYKPQTALGKRITKNQRVFPLHPTSVNRGYIKGRLDKDSLLINITSSCGPLVYRGNQFPKEFQQNAFSCAPEVNAIKRNVLHFSNTNTKATQATPKKEFIASTDEGFRPVNLFNAPDGALYVVDMHRGIIQDKAYLTPYLKDHYKKKQLDTITGMGRILKVSHQNSSHQKFIDITKLSISELVVLLEHPNGWYRDKAQQRIIYLGDYRAVSLLKKLILNTKNPNTQIHGLHTLNGLDALDYVFLKQVIVSTKNSKTISHTLVLLEQFASSKFVSNMINLTQNLLSKNNSEIGLYLSSSLNKWVEVAPFQFYKLILKISNKYADSQLHQEGIINSLRNHETEFVDFCLSNSTPILSKHLQEIIEICNNNKEKGFKKQSKNLKTKNSKSIKSGKKIFNNICATCHGNQGQGIASLAPPFVGSEFISESSERLALVLLHGLSGPIHVNGKLYRLNATMPGLVNNPEYNNKDIQNIIVYLQNTFADKEKPISIQKINSLRALKPRNGVYSEEELLKH